MFFCSPSRPQCLLLVLNVLRALTFKVPLPFPPTFTLILLPKENFPEQKRKRDVKRAQVGTLFQHPSSLKTALLLLLSPHVPC